MKVVALISGGKDSCHNILHCINEGHEVIALAHLKPSNLDEADSFMYQSVGHSVVHYIAEAMGLRLFQAKIEGFPKNVLLDYHATEEDEVEDMYNLLKTVKDDMNVEAVSSGAILSDYQRLRVENVCKRLGLISLAYLWRRNQEELLNEMINCNIEAVIIKVAALGLNPNYHLGKTISILRPDILKLSKLYGLNVCGEGGEYETFTLNCPMFKQKVVIDEFSKVFHDCKCDDAENTVAYLNLTKVHLEHKESGTMDIQENIKMLPMLSSRSWYDVLGLNHNNWNVSDDLRKNNLSVLNQTFPVHHKISEFYTGIQMLQNDVYSIVNIAVTNNKNECVTIAASRTFELLINLLSKYKLSTSDIAIVSLYLKQMNDFVAVNEVYKTLFNHEFPARVCISVCLPNNVQLMMDVCCHKTNNERGLAKKVMHVESLSHWAPACIGPYSQSIRVGDAIYLAGQIGLVPETQQLIEGGIISQCRLALHHIEQVLFAMGGSKDDLVDMTAFVIDQNFIDHAILELKRFFSSVDEFKTIMQYVVVPGLPKGALVEWHAYAVCNCDNSQNYQTCFQDQNISVNVILKNNKYAQFGSIYYGQASLFAIDGLMTNILLDHAVTTLFTAINNFKNEVLSGSNSANNTSFKVVKLYYCSPLFSLDEIERCCQMCDITKIFSSIAIVPVTYLKKNELICVSF